MVGFFLQNIVAVGVGLLAGTIYYFLLSEGNQWVLLTVVACGFLGVHLPNIQQPTLPSYQLIRKASWLASLLVPLAIFFYRPTEFIPAWIVTLLFTSSFWSLIDRISLQRDFTRSTPGIILLPLLVTGCAHLSLGEAAILPVYLACSSGYICFLFTENFLENRKTPANSQQPKQNPNENLAN